ncbi:MAG: ABC transporter permease, partial [Firmicutes bacterium]|nr:ABC transporter permease [Bacillota bacterium]
QTFDIGLASQESGHLEEAISKAFGTVPAFRLHHGSLDEELAALKKGKRNLVVVVPTEASVGANLRGGLEVPIYYDASRPTSSQVLLPAVDRVFAEIERQFTHRPELFAIKSQAVQSEGLRSIDYLLPGILGMALMQLGLFGSLRLVSLRERKILRNLGATPLNRVALLGGEVTVRLLMSLFQALSIVVIGHLVFKVTIVGNWLAVAGIVLLGAATFTSLGYMLVSFAKTEESGQGLIQVVQFPMMFLSGIFFPPGFMPAFLRPVVKAIPLTYLADALRQVMVGFAPEHSLTTNLTVLFAWMVVTLVLASRLWRWE